MKASAASRMTESSYQEFNEALASFEDIDPAIVGLTPTGEIVYANRSACELLGHPKERLKGISIGAFTPGMTSSGWASFWSELDRDDVDRGRTTLRLPGRKELSIEFRALFNRPAGLKYCMMIEPDNQPATAFRRGNHGWPLVRALESMTDPVMVQDEHHRVTFLNQAACHALGTTAAKSSGMTVYDYLPKRQAEVAWQQEQDALDSGRPSTHAGDVFLQARYGESVTMLPCLDPGTQQKRLLCIVNRPVAAADPLPRATSESHEPAVRGLSSGYECELHNILERRAPMGILLKNRGNRYLWVNHAFAKIFGFEPGNFIGMRVEDLVSDPEVLAVVRKEDDYIYSTGKPVFNRISPRFNGQPGYYRLDKFPFISKDGMVNGIIGLGVEVSEPRPPIDALKNQIALTSKKLRETEMALRILIEAMGQELSRTREKIQTKAKGLVVPYLEQLKQARLKPEQAELVDLIEENLKDFGGPALGKLSSPAFKLSPTELKVAQLIRDGKTNKEIAKLLRLSKSTILTHRHHVRAKLGIKNKKINLRSLLNS